MKEIRYAALLHDFGKVGVREDVLVKAKKLYPWQLDLVKGRFDFIRKEIEAETSRRKTGSDSRARPGSRVRGICGARQGVRSPHEGD